MSLGARGGLRVAVTGAAGYLGRALIRRLLADPWVTLVVGLDARAWSGSEAPDPMRFEFYQQDVASADLADRLTGLDAVFHLAFVLDSRTPDAVAHRTDVEGSWNLLRAAAAAGLNRVVLASSISAYGAWPDNPARLTEERPLRARADYRYAFHKALVEQMAVRFEAAPGRPRVVRLRIATVLGPPPRPGAADDLLRAPVLALPASFRVQFVHVDDVAEAFLAALQERAWGAYNVAAGPPLSGQELARVSRQRFMPLPRGLLGAGRGLLAALGVDDPGRLALLVHSILVDTSRIETELGWRPRVDGLACLHALFPGAG